MSKWILACIVLFIIAVYLYQKRIHHTLKMEEYWIKVPQMTSGQVPVNCVLLTDLHGNQFGNHNQRLIEAIKKTKPDMIFISGDMFVKSKTFDPTVALELIKELVKICPVYYGNGNHEKKVCDFWEESREDFFLYKKQVEEMGVHYLMNESIDVNLNDIPFRITGLDLGLEHFQKIYKKPTLNVEKITEYIGNPCEVERFQILIAHNPQYFDEYANWGADLVLAGHVHGAMIILPGLGGVIAPNWKVFPKYDFGEFHIGKSTMILSRGLGMHTLKIRIFNEPEISVIHFVSMD